MVSESKVYSICLQFNNKILKRRNIHLNDPQMNNVVVYVYRKEKANTHVLSTINRKQCPVCLGIIFLANIKRFQLIINHCLREALE